MKRSHPRPISEAVKKLCRPAERYFVILVDDVYKTRKIGLELHAFQPIFVEEPKDNALVDILWPYDKTIPRKRRPNALLTYTGQGVVMGEPVDILNFEDKNGLYSDWMPIILYTDGFNYFMDRSQAFPPLTPLVTDEDVEEDEEEEEQDPLAGLSQKEIESLFN